MVVVARTAPVAGPAVARDLELAGVLFLQLELLLLGAVGVLLERVVVASPRPFSFGNEQALGWRDVIPEGRRSGLARGAPRGVGRGPWPVHVHLGPVVGQRVVLGVEVDS